MKRFSSRKLSTLLLSGMALASCSLGGGGGSSGGGGGGNTPTAGGITKSCAEMAGCSIISNKGRWGSINYGTLTFNSSDSLSFTDLSGKIVYIQGLDGKNEKITYLDPSTIYPTTQQAGGNFDFSHSAYYADLTHHNLPYLLIGADKDNKSYKAFYNDPKSGWGTPFGGTSSFNVVDYYGNQTGIIPLYVFNSVVRDPNQGKAFEGRYGFYSDGMFVYDSPIKYVNAFPHDTYPAVSYPQVENHQVVDVVNHFENYTDAPDANLFAANMLTNRYSCDQYSCYDYSDYQYVLPQGVKLMYTNGIISVGSDGYLYCQNNSTGTLKEAKARLYRLSGFSKLSRNMYPGSNDVHIAEYYQGKKPNGSFDTENDMVAVSDANNDIIILRANEQDELNQKSWCSLKR